MNYKLSAGIGVIGGAVSYLFGGWDASLQALLLFMAADYITGLAAAALFRHSPKTESGGLSSKVCFQGLVRKGMVLLLVLLAHRLDTVLAVSYIRDGVCIAFLANELISIIENAGLMGVPIPEVVRHAIDLLKQKGEHHD